MDHLLGVAVLDASNHLLQVEASLEIVQALASLDQVRQRLILTQIQHHVHIERVLEVALEEHHVLVRKHAVDLDFRL